VQNSLYHTQNEQKTKTNQNNRSTPGIFPRLVTFSIGLAIVATLILPMGLIRASAQDALTVTTTIDSVQLNEDGTVTVTFTVECSESATISSSLAFVTQSVGRFGQKEVSGGAGSPETVQCDADGVQLTQTVIAESGFFVPGRAVVTASAVACDESGFCVGGDDRQVVRLRR
jgi:hypothetical protein